MKAKCIDCENLVETDSSHPRRLCKTCKLKAHRQTDKLRRDTYPLMYTANIAKSEMRAFLRKLKLPKDFDIREITYFEKVTNIDLEKVAKQNGYPDFIKECLEEKGPKRDFLTESQLARAILEYRSGRKYKVAWRYTSTKRRIFQTVFDFYEWQQKRGIEEKTKWQHKHKKR